MKVTFCGHSSIMPREREFIKQKLHTELERLIKLGADEFLLGGYGDFDLLCAIAVKELKILYPHIKSVLVVPYINRSYNKNLYDCSEYPPIEKTPPRYAISKRNEYMVNKSDFVVAYVKHSWGGAAATLRYAEQKKKQIVSI